MRVSERSRGSTVVLICMALALSAWICMLVSRAGFLPPTGSQARLERRGRGKKNNDDDDKNEKERERERERENIKKRNERKYKKWNWKDDSNSWWILSAGKFSAGAVIAARRQPPGSVLRSSACLRREERHRRHRLPFPLLMDVARARDSLMSVVAMMRMFL